MAELNHLIVPVHDKHKSAKFLADLLGVEAGAEWGPFVPVQTTNGVTLDFVDSADVRTQHYAFLVSEQVFDAALAKLKQQGVQIFANPHRSGAGKINRNDGGRGMYFDDPSGHWMELITRPYGSKPE
jgi:catechol 2,3-dioxygenase-like lactoylglutathione lyase family enzyme